VHRILDDLVPAFQRATGKTIAAAFASSGGVKSRVLSGEGVDVVITTQAAMAELAASDKIQKDSAVVIARSPIGIAVHAGAPKPDIGTVEAFKNALMQAKSIAYADPATGSPSANYLVEVLDRFGMTDALKPKTKLIGATPGSVVVVCDAVANGEAEIGIQQISEILGVAGVELVGPLPSEVQHLTVFSAAVGAHARDAAVASDLIAFMTSPVAAPTIEARGMLTAKSKRYSTAL
jgi:molybdate transport system substrate-binding protein